MTRLLPELYDARFDEREVSTKDAVWREIVGFLGRYIDTSWPVLDVACDRGHFIRWIDASERWATDIRDVSEHLPAGVRFTRSSGLELEQTLPLGHFGTVFMSNYLEHLESSDEVIEQLRVACRLLRPGGRAIVLQPNIRLVGPRYWDFIDHRVALTDRSLLEAAELAGLRTVDSSPGSCRIRRRAGSPSRPPWSVPICGCVQRGWSWAARPCTSEKHDRDAAPVQLIQGLANELQYAITDPTLWLSIVLALVIGASCSSRSERGWLGSSGSSGPVRRRASSSASAYRSGCSSWPRGGRRSGPAGGVRSLR